MAEQLTMRIGHELEAITVTNGSNMVPVCSCGWIGSVHPTYLRHTYSDDPGTRVWRYADQNARAEHAKHAAG